MKYFAKFEEDSEAGGFTITFRDIPEIVTQGKNFADSLHAAEDALELVSSIYEEQGSFLPVPTSPLHGEVAVFMREKE